MKLSPNISQPSSDARRALASIIKDNSPRTNQFAVKERFAGVEEKCRIFNNDELANALARRYDQLNSWSSKWKFEVLDLLLQLSDSPADKTRIEDLDLLAGSPGPAVLTWNEILKDDPLDNRSGVWDNVDFGQASSESGEGSYYEDSGDSDSGIDIDFLDGGDAMNVIESFEAVPDLEAFRGIQVNRDPYDRANTNESHHTETRIIREAIFMLHGLPTATFKEVDGRVQQSPAIALERLTTVSIRNALAGVCDIGTRLLSLRNWAHGNESIPVLQTLQASLVLRLQDMSATLSTIEKRTLKAIGTATTLTSLLSEAEEAAKRILLLANVIPSNQDPDRKRSIFVLEALYEVVCGQQALGDTENYYYVANIFLECFQTYLRPIRNWMEAGTLPEEDAAFFVRRAKKDLPPAALWSEQFFIAMNELSKPIAPKFLHSHVPSIFASGKAVNFIKALGDEWQMEDSADEPTLTFASVCQPKSDLLSPFGELFNKSFDRWIESKHRLSSVQLLETLSSKFDLWATFDALEHVYFGKNGALTQQVAFAIFDRIDKGKRWQDRFALTDLLRDKFSSASSVNGVNLSVRFIESRVSQQAQPRSVIQLEGLAINYELSWQLATIIKPEISTVYQQTSVLLLQLLRAKHVLDQQSSQHYSIPTSQRNLVLSLRHRLRWLTEVVQNYILNEALHPTLTVLHAQMRAAKDLDTMIARYAANIVELQHACMLAGQQSSTHQALMSILDLVVVFSDSVSFSTAVRAPDCDRATRSNESDSSEDDNVIDNSGDKAATLPESIRLQLENFSVAYDRLLNFFFTGARDLSRSQKGSRLRVLVDDLKFGINVP